nr:MAG TPA: minor capsid protein [Caudoviricetes sp.]
MKPTEEIAVRLVGGAQSAYVQELSYFFLNLLDEVVRTNGAVIRGREIADFERLSRLSREEALAIYYKYRPTIDKQTREVLKTALKKTDDALVGQFVRAMGSRRHMTNLATIIAAQTAQGMNEVLERQNIALAKDQAALWYDVTAEAIARHQAGEPTRAVMERGVTRLANSGLETIDYISGTKTTIDAALRRHIVSQANQARNRLLMQRMDEWEWDLVFVDAHFGARPSHAEWQGKVYSRSGRSTEYPSLVESTGYGTVTGLCGANCVVGDTKVSGPNALAAYRRKYSGEIVTIRTALGHNLTVTPNHPILTPHGWVAANKLSKGDYVFSRVNSDGMPLGVRPNKYEGEPSIKNEFNALGDTFGVNSFLGSTTDFHNDGIKNQNVDIVFVDSKLMRNADSKALKHFSETSFFNASRFSNISFGSSSLTKVGMSLFSSSDSIMSGFANKASFFRRISRHLSLHGQTATFGIDSTFFKPISNRRLGNTKLLGDNSFIEPFIPKVNDTFDINTLLTSIGIQAKSFEFAGDNPIPASEMLSHSSDRSPFIVEPDEIISVDTRMWSGHVYNLSTENAWYFANSIVTHNCYHYMTPYVPGYSELPDMDYSEQERITGMTSDEYYAATQKQRRYERLIRSQKREISYLQEVRADAVKQRIRLGELQDKLRQFTHDNHLRRDYERERAWAVSKQPIALRTVPASSGQRKDKGPKFQAIQKAITANNPIFFPSRGAANNILKAGVTRIRKNFGGGRYIIGAHGSPRSIQLYDIKGIKPKILSNILANRNDYNGEPIQLMCCSTGKVIGGTCFAQELADLVGVDVYAPPSDLYINAAGKYFISTKSGKLYGTECMVRFSPRLEG